MFACIYFIEDASLCVVGEKDANLKVITEFCVNGSVEMIWKRAGKSEIFHGTIIKVHDNEEFVTKFANNADMILKKCSEKPSVIPQALFEFALPEESVSGKRKSKQTDKLKESKQQERKQPESSSPKKKKVGPQIPTVEKKKTTVKASGPNLEKQKKSAQVSANLLADTEISNMLSQFVNESDTSQKDTPMLDTWKLCTALDNSGDKEDHTALDNSGDKEDHKIPVPSAEVLNFFRGFQKKEVTTFVAKMIQHFEKDSTCSHANNECFQIPAQQNEVSASSSHSMSQWASSAQTHPDFRNQDSNVPQQTTLLPSPRRILDMSNSLPHNQRSTPNRYLPSQATSSSGCAHPSEHLPPFNAMHSPVLPFSNDMQHSAAVHNPPPAEIHSSMQSYQNLPVVYGSSCVSAQFNGASNYSNAFEMECNAPKENMITPSPRRSPRKSNPGTPGDKSSQNVDLQDLLKKFPDVKVRPDVLTSAIAAARKSVKPGYTLCYNLIMGVFTLEEIANSRGQGLTKAKEGDLRPALNKEKCAAVKEYSIRWCKKEEKVLTSDAELNNAITEQVSHSRKKMKKQLKMN